MSERTGNSRPKGAKSESSDAESDASRARDRPIENSAAPRLGGVRVGEENLVVLSWSVEPELPQGLTEAEREVVLLVLRGYSNVEIAAARNTQARTVANQLASIYRKLKLSSRAELAARIAGGLRKDERG